MGRFRVAVFCATACLSSLPSLAQIGMISQTRTEIRGSHAPLICHFGGSIMVSEAKPACAVEKPA